MLRRSIFAVFLLSLSAGAVAMESFDERVTLAKAAEADDQLKAYLPSMYGAVGPQVASTMRTCFDRTEGGDKSPFVLVADISAAGAAQNIEVKPSTNVSQCFARGFSSITFPAPPASTKRAAFPVMIEMRVAK
jgi:hypothetical protein